VFLSSAPRRILAYSAPVDMRKSFTGLVAVVQSVLEEDPLTGDLYVFFNRRGNYLKLVTWDRTGYCLFAKKLEHGRFRLPSGEAKQEISERAFRLILDGIVLGSTVPSSQLRRAPRLTTSPWLVLPVALLELQHG
jgi:transposase